MEIDNASALYLFRPPLFESLPALENDRDHEDHGALFEHLEKREWLSAARTAATIRSRHFARIDTLFEDETNRRVNFTAASTLRATTRAIVEGLAAKEPSDSELEQAISDAHLSVLSAARMERLIRDPKYRRSYFELLELRGQLSYSRSSPGWPIREATLGAYGVMLARAAWFSQQMKDVPVPKGASAAIDTVMTSVEQSSFRFISGVKASLATLDQEATFHHCQVFRRRVLLDLDRLANLIGLSARLWVSSLTASLESQRAHAVRMLALGRVIREHYSFLTLSIRLTKIASLPQWAEEVARWQKAASSLGMASKVEAGARVAHGALLSNPREYEGKLVELSGVIESMRTLKERTSSGEKMSTFFMCREISQDRDVIEIAVPYSNLPEQGLVNGMPCRLSGVPYEGADGPWRIRLSEHRYADLAKESFYDLCQKEIGEIFPAHFLRKNLEIGYLPGGDQLAVGGLEVRRILIGN